MKLTVINGIIEAVEEPLTPIQFDNDLSEYMECLNCVIEEHREIQAKVQNMLR